MPRAIRPWLRPKVGGGEKGRRGDNYVNVALPADFSFEREARDGRRPAHAWKAAYLLVPPGEKGTPSKRAACRPITSPSQDSRKGKKKKEDFVPGAAERGERRKEGKGGRGE